MYSLNSGAFPSATCGVEHLERLYAKLLDHGRANRAGGLDTKTVLEIHMVIRRALTDAAPARDHHPQPGRGRARTETTAARQRRTTRLERPTTQGLSRPRRRSPTLRHVLARREHRHATRRTPRAALERHRHRRTTTVRQPRADLASATNSTNHEARHEPHAAPSISTNAPSRSSPRSPPAASTTTTCSATTTEHRSIRTSSPTRSRNSSPRSALPRIRFHDLRHTHATLAPQGRRSHQGRQRTPRTRRHPGSRWRPTNTSCLACNRKLRARSPRSSIRLPVPPGGTPGRTQPVALRPRTRRGL